METFKKPNLRIWSKQEITALPKEEKEEVKEEFIPKPEIPRSRLNTLSLIVNTGGAYKAKDYEENK